MTRRTRILIQGGGDEVLPVVDALAASSRFDVVGWCDSPSIDATLSRTFPHGQAEQSGEASGVDDDSIIVVGYGLAGAAHESRLRELARDGIPMVLVQPPCSAIFAMELDMIQRDTRAPLVPIHAASLHPAVDGLIEIMRTHPSLTKIEQIVMERRAHDRADDVVLRWLAQDAMLLRRLMGDFQQVGAMRTDDDASLSNLSVHLQGRVDAIGRWSIGPVIDTPGAVLSIIAEQCQVSLTLPVEGRWTFSSSIDMPAPPLDFQEAEHLRTHVEEALRDQPAQPSWEDALRSMDLADVASESARRRKTLPIRNERLTEEDTFKGMMAAGGCFILLVLPLILLLMSLVDALDIPVQKHVTVTASPGQTAVYLPADTKKLEQLRLGQSGRSLRPFPSVEALRTAYQANEPGRPQAYATSSGQLVVGPVPDAKYELIVVYRGTFSLAQWWLLFLLIPMAIFLCLQLFKLVFPKPSRANA